MPRNKAFTREPFHGDDALSLERALGPVGFLNPTRAHFSHSKENAQPAVSFLWRSRDSRKGRHPLLIPSSESNLPRATSHPAEILKTIVRTVTYFPVWDISWLVAFIFTLGSVVWVINVSISRLVRNLLTPQGSFSWLPLVAPASEFSGESYYGGGITAFIGAIVFFETGSILLVVEATNADRSGCFGWAVEQLTDTNVQVVKSYCQHHHQNKSNLVGKPSTTAADGSTPAWKWFPSLHDLRTHYIHELGFLAGCAQLFGATVFGVAGFTALPGIFNHLEPQWRLNAAFWIPQVVGGCGFIMSGTLYMLETQEKWWKPAPHLLGWHIAFWNLIGAFGFTLCGALGMAYGSSGAQFQASLATFWYDSLPVIHVTNG